MSKIVMSILLGLLTAGLSAAVVEPARQDAFAAIEGDWATQGYGAVVRMAPCEDDPEALCGDLVWAWEPEEMAPGSIGAEMFSGARFDGERWAGGALRNPEDGRTYRGVITQVSENELKLRGCAAIFCKTQTWRRLESLPHIAGLPDEKPE